MTDFGRHLLPALIHERRVYCYIYEDYWRDVGTLDAYFDANMDLIADLPDFNLYDPEWPVRTVARDFAPVRFHAGGSAARSLVAEGCKVHGAVRNSVVFPGVQIGPGTVVESSIILDGCAIGADCRLERVIIDKETTVGPGCVLGHGDDYTPNRHYPESLTSGLVVVGRESQLPAGLRLARNACVEVGAKPSDFETLDVGPGEYVAASAV
jgi:glucose-1-phosphate adenylyltransferase